MGATTTYTYATSTAAYLNPHAAATVGNYNYTYDNNGNLLTVAVGTSTPVSSYTWDYNNRLTNATSSGVVSSDAYDFTGQRVKQTIGATTTIYSSKFYSTDGTTPTKHIYLPDGTLVATVTGTGTSSVVSYVHVDHLGGANVVTDSDGAVSEIFDALPYGGTRLDEKSGSFSERFKFAQLERDDNGLDYARARYYNSSRGQFASQDPTVRDNPEKFLADPQQMNYYSYGRDNPITIIDPFGLYVVSSGLVEKGDTLGKITGILNSTNGTNYSVNQVALLNGIKNPNLIYAGQTIIPNNSTPDITKSLNSVNRADAAFASSKAVVGGNSALSTPSHLGGVDIIGFANNFREGGDWDLKSQQGVFCQEKGCGGPVADNYVFGAQKIPGDAPGNIHYGYVGHAAGKSLETLHAAGDVVQNATDLGSNLRNGNWNRPFPTWDPYSDKYYISWGYSLYGY